MSTISASTTSTTAYVVTADTTGTLVLQTGATPTTAVTIDTSQNVGIGTASPTDNLYVSRATNAAGGISVVNTNNAQASQIAQLYLQGGDNAYAQIKLQANSVNSSIRGNNDGSLAFLSSTTERMRIDSSGNVLIATTNAITGITGAQLTASNTSENPAYINIFRDDTTIGNGQFLGYLQFCGRDATSSLGTAHAYVGAVAEADHGAGDNATAITFGTTPDNSSSMAERMRILSGGAVCINTTQAQVDGTSRLVVATTTASGIAAEFSNNTSGTCAVAINNSGAATSTLVNWYAGGSYRSAITWNGSLIVYGTSSDARLKENITDAGSGLAKLADVKIRSFDWKESGAHTDFGVVAQELQAVAPEAVLVGKDNEDGSMKESWSVDSSILVPAMIKAIQELKAINDTQAETINALTARIVALESRGTV